jgi:hypothetical protein
MMEAGGPREGEREGGGHSWGQDQGAELCEGIPITELTFSQWEILCNSHPQGLAPMSVILSGILSYD